MKLKNAGNLARSEIYHQKLETWEPVVKNRNASKKDEMTISSVTKVVLFLTVAGAAFDAVSAVNTTVRGRSNNNVSTFGCDQLPGTSFLGDCSVTEMNNVTYPMSAQLNVSSASSPPSLESTANLTIFGVNRALNLSSVNCKNYDKRGMNDNCENNTLGITFSGYNQRYSKYHYLTATGQGSGQRYGNTKTLVMKGQDTSDSPILFNCLFTATDPEEKKEAGTAAHENEKPASILNIQMHK